MLFNSVDFLLFFPPVVLAYFLWPARWRYLWLLAASYFFYGCWNAKYAILLLFSTVATWITGLVLERCRAGRFPRRGADAVFALCLVANLGVLGLFKYVDFILLNLNALLAPAGVSLEKPNDLVFLLPVGISFYTFQALGYAIDVRRGTIRAERNFFRYALFVSFFPQLVAGPIERASHLLPQFRRPTFFHVPDVRRGLLAMAYGLFLKVVVADNLAAVANPVFAQGAAAHGMRLLTATVLFAFQIYCDFEGYSQIAIGSARVLGFRIDANFRTPYLAGSVRDFWRRWHVSLTSWFKDYLYIPLGGNRRGRLRKWANLVFVFLVSGLWHGAAWNFVAWGGANGLLLVAQDATEGLRAKIRRLLRIDPASFGWRAFSVFATFALVDATWLLFRAPDLGAAWAIARRIAAQFDPLYFLTSDFAAMFGPPPRGGVVAFALLATAACDLVRARVPDAAGRILRQSAVFRWAFYLLALASLFLLGAYGKNHEPSQFIYFQF